MNNNSSYIIEKLTVDVNTSSVQQGYEIKDNVRSFIDQHVVPAIENYLMKLSKEVREDQVLQIDKLTLTVNSKQAQWATSGLQQAIQDEFDKAIKVAQSELAKGLTPYGKQSVSEITKTAQSSDHLTLVEPEIQNLTVIARSEHIVLAWISFLQNGSTNWLPAEISQDTTASQEAKLLEMILGSREKVLSNRMKVFESSIAFNRLIGQFSTGFLMTLATILQRESISVSYSSVISGKEQQTETFLKVLLSNSSGALKQRFWELLFRFLRLQNTGEALSDPQLLEVLMELISANKMTQSISGILPVIPLADQPFGENKNTDRPGKTSALSNDKGTSKKIPAADEEQMKLKQHDSSAGYLYLLEWLHQLQSAVKPVSYYATLQQQVLKGKKSFSTGQMNPDAEISTFIDGDETGLSAGKTNRLTSSAENNRQESAEVSGKLDPIQHDLAETSKAESGEITATDKNNALEQDSILPANKTSENEAVSETNSGLAKNDLETPSVESKVGVTANEVSENRSVSPDSPTADFAERNQSTRKKEKEAIAAALKKSTGNQPHLLVENAGLVIIHPFLKHFFTGTGILNEDNKLTDPVLAAHVLHYIATGKEHDFEQHMLFEKHLAGIDQQESIEREIVISDAIKEEVESLWNAVRENWAPMKTASVAAIRETFIQRQGKLIHESPNPRLIIEHKTVDILLGQLNWTISIIRLPWLDEIIFVEW